MCSVLQEFNFSILRTRLHVHKCLNQLIRRINLPCLSALKLNKWQKTACGTGKAICTSNTDNSCKAVTKETPHSNLGFRLEVHTCAISTNLSDAPHALAERSPTGQHQHRFIPSAPLVHDLTNPELYFTTSAGRS
jgi:hypothetical protein